MLYNYNFNKNDKNDAQPNNLLITILLQLLSRSSLIKKVFLRLMRLRKFKVLIVLIFLGIFSAKMIISIAPAFSFDLDKVTVNNVIMQLELEQHNDKDGSKAVDKLLESKYFHYHAISLVNLSNSEQGLDNNFIEHSKRYVNPYHPSVPTPPPNFS
jgi:hypothetical protein